MKAESVETLQRLGAWVLAGVLLLLLWAYTTPARAEKLPDGLKEFEADVACSQDLCVLPRDQFLAIAAANRKMQDAIEQRGAPKCATVEPEPKKEPPKLPEGDGPKRRT